MLVTQHAQVGRLAVLAIVSTILLARCELFGPEEVPRLNPHRTAEGWWKGNLHTHTLWSDGDDYPEMVMDWYKQNGYHFVAVSDHDILPTGSRWIQPARHPKGLSTLRSYRDRFDTETEQRGGELMVRLKTLEEFRPLFEEPGVFLIIQSEEISDHLGDVSIHISATNVKEFIPQQHGSSVREVLQNNIDAVLDQRRRTGQPMIPHVSHPNLGWAITARDIADVVGEQFFEVFNGHPGASNVGDSRHQSTDAMWDDILAQRLTRAEKIVYGLAVDDAHSYRERHPRLANPGRGWVMVRARSDLSAATIIEALESGDFYSSTGVVLTDVSWDGKSIRIDIEVEDGVLYETTFVGTVRSDGTAASPDAPVRAGVALATSTATSPAYTLSGDELYVRARIVSTRPMAIPARDLRHEMAWTQPVVPQP